MLYHALHLGESCVVRNAEEGITDHEFSVGVRSTLYGYHTSRQELIDKILDDNVLEIFTQDEWRDLISLPSNLNEYYKNTYKKWDKWDKKSPIY